MPTDKTLLAFCKKYPKYFKNFGPAQNLDEAREGIAWAMKNRKLLDAAMAAEKKEKVKERERERERAT